MEVFPSYVSTVLPYLIILTIVVGIIITYISLRIRLSIPIFMIEKKGCIESVKESWRITKGKFWSLFFTLLVLGLVVGVISGILTIIPFGQIIFDLIFTPLSLILPTAYYYSIKMEGRKRQE